MADKETTTFETVGDDVSSIFNDRSGSAAASPYTMTQPRDAGSASGDIQGVGTKANKSGTQINEANGPACKVIAKIVYPTSPDAPRTVRLVKPAGGNAFYGARNDAGNTGGV